MIAATGRFVANVLDREDEHCPEVIRHFGFQSGRTVDKFAETPHELGENGIPILPEAKAFYECRVVPEMTQDLGTHTLFVALVERAGTREDGEPITYNEYRKTMRKGR
jgi:flavin reductase (DIM6/NTAB) family NADH-FMN oxidoreductase RutF